MVVHQVIEQRSVQDRGGIKLLPRDGGADTVKIPEPITAPIPSAVSDQGPSVFFRQCSGNSESLISLSIDLVANSCFRSVSAPLCYAVLYLHIAESPKGTTVISPGR